MFTTKFFKTLGPGILFATTAIGVSHLVQSTRAGAEYGFALIGFVLMANILKYPFFEYGSRYANATGKSLIYGYNKIGKGMLLLYLLITLISMFTVAAAVTYVCVGLMINLFQLSFTPSEASILLMAICMVILLSGKFSLLDSLVKLIGAVLLGNNFVNILAASLTTVLCLNLFGDSGVVIGSIVLTLIILVFAEITPKTFAALNSEKVALPASLILKYLQKILRPLVLFVNFFSNFFMRLLGTKETTINEDLSPEELKSVLENSGDLIPKKYQDMLISVLELDKVSVDEVMTQRSEVIGIDINQPIENILSNLQNNQKDFLPVYDESLDDLRGVIDLYGITAFLSNEDKSIESLIESLEEAYFIPENTPLSTQLFNFQKNKKTVAVIIDEYGSVKGLVTIKDVLEEIVGELATDIDRAVSYTHLTLPTILLV